MRRLLFLPLLLTLPGCGWRATWDAHRENAEGVKALHAQNPAGAAEHFIAGLGATPFEIALHLNLGLALDQQKKADDAVKSYQIAEATARDDNERFVARFNLGEILARAKRVDEALSWYQRALELKPDSLETKVNIELLTKSQQGQGGDSKDQQKDGQGQNQNKDDKNKNDKDKNDKDQKDKDQKDPKDSEDKSKEYGQSQKYKPRPFKGDINESEVKKILGEIRQQEQKIRAEFNRKDVKERPRDKDW